TSAGTAPRVPSVGRKASCSSVPSLTATLEGVPGGASPEARQFLHEGRVSSKRRPVGGDAATHRPRSRPGAVTCSPVELALKSSLSHCRAGGSVVRGPFPGRGSSQMREAPRPLACWVTSRLASLQRWSPRLRWVIAGIFAAATVTAPPFGSQIVGAQEPSNGAVSISPAPMVHVLKPGAVPPGTAAAASRVVDGRTTVAGAVSAGLHITATFDVSITSDPNAAAIEAAINTAIGNFESQFSDPITVNITFSTGGGLGGSSAYYGNLSY